MNKPSSNSVGRCLAALAVALLLANPTLAQEGDSLDQAGQAFRDAMRRVLIPTSSLTDGPQVRRAFREAVAEAAEATVEVREDGQQVALGGIVGTDGWVITKADQLEGEVTCFMKDGRELPARVVGVDRAYDLAMLKIDANQLPVLSLKRDDDAEVGEWVATVAPKRDPVAVGIVAVDTRTIRPQRGWLGIQMDTISSSAVRVAQVFEGSAAESAGLQVNDEIVEINEQPIETPRQLSSEIMKYTVGDIIEIEVQRGRERLSLQAVLTPPVPSMGSAGDNRKEFQNNLGSELSRRRFGFERAFQHDTVLKPTDCGGPLVDLEGRVVGFNIARSGRTESYAIPSNVAITRFYDLMSGNLTPSDAPQPEPEPAPEGDTEPVKTPAE